MQSYEKIGKLPILAMLKIRMQPLFTSFFCLKTPSLHFFFTIFIRFYSIIIMYYRNSMILRDKKRRLKQNVYALFTQTWKKHLRETRKCLIFMWTSQGLNLGPPDYESVALTNWATSPNLPLEGGMTHHKVQIAVQRYDDFCKYPNFLWEK